MRMTSPTSINVNDGSTPPKSSRIMLCAAQSIFEAPSAMRTWQKISLYGSETKLGQITVFA